MTVHKNLTLQGDSRILPKNPITKKVYKKSDIEFSKLSARSYTFFIVKVPHSDYPNVCKKASCESHNLEVTTQRGLNVLAEIRILPHEGSKPDFSQHKEVM